MASLVDRRGVALETAVVEVYDDEVLSVRTSLSPETMSRVNSALAAALALPAPGGVAP